MRKCIIVTGAAGFIGFHLCKRLINNNFNVIGIDNLNTYYDINLKKSRLKNIEEISSEKQNWKFFKTNLEEMSALDNIFQECEPQTIFHLAAQAGVRYSLKNPKAYIDSNIVGFSNLLECCRKFHIHNLIYSSSSSVYGGNTKVPFSEDDAVNHPLSLYAATKRSNELMAHAYSHLYDLNATGLRLFTVYGPWGRPDMAPMIFTKSILEHEKINIFNGGDISRDFTFIDDVIDVFIKLINKPAERDEQFNPHSPNPSTSWAPHRIYNVGNSNPIPIEDFILELEKKLGIKAIKEYKGMQPGDVKTTFANTNKLGNLIKYKPTTSIDRGIKLFIDWYKDYYKIS